MECVRYMPAPTVKADMRPPNQTARYRPPPMPRETSVRLLRALEELRALELEKRRTAASTPPFDDLARRLEAKAREVFRLASAAELEGADRRH
jgi:hypothetical protein